MPLLDTGVIAAASGPTIHTATTYDGLAKTGVANGDRGEVRTDVADADTATGFFRAYYDADIGRPVWVPADLWDSISAYVSNALGKAAILPADDYAALTARGWTNADTGGGASTKTAGNPLVIDAPSNPSNGSTRFVATSPPARSFWAAKVEWKSGTVALWTSIIDGDNSYYVRASLGHGTGGYVRMTVSGAVVSQGTLNLSGAEWLFGVRNGAAAETINTIWTPDYDEERMITAERQDGGIGAAPRLNLFTANSGTGVHQIEVTELHYLVLT